MKIRALGITSVLHRRHDREESARFLSAFRSAAALNDEEKALVACLRLCEYIQTKASVTNPNAAALLVGISEEEYGSYRQISGPIVVSGNLLSTSLTYLLLLMDPNISVFNEGNVFFSVLRAKDYLSATPLEAAYIWSLSSKSALQGG
jgi:hypothetical protein